MTLDMNYIRNEFAEKILANDGDKGSMDAALFHVVKIAFEQGRAAGGSVPEGWQAALSAKSVLPNQEPRDAQQLKECVWSEEDDENMPNTWNGDCGAMWTFTEGGVKDNSMHYCPECGGKVVIAELANRKGG